MGQKVAIRVIEPGAAADELVHELEIAAQPLGDVSREDGHVVVALRSETPGVAVDDLRRLALLTNDHADELVRIEPV